MSSNTNIQYYINTQVEYAEPLNDVKIKIGCNDLTDKGIVLDYDLGVVPKRFKINPGGMNWTDGINTFNTNLDKLCALEIALPALQVAPNSTTMKLNNTLLLDNGGTDVTTVDNQHLYLTGNVSNTDEYNDITKGQIFMENKLGGGGNNTLISINCEDGTGHPLIQTTLYENSTIIRDDYIKIGNKSYNTSINSGDLYCNNVNLNTINGMTPTTIGLTWGDFTGTNAYNNLPSNQYQLDNGFSSRTTMVSNGLQINNLSSGYSGILSIIGTNTFAMDSSNGVGALGDVNNNSNHTNLIVNDPHREIDINSVDIISNCGTSGNFYTLPILFTNKASGNYNYTNTSNWELVFATTMAIPVEQLNLTNGLTTWKMDFAINCWNMSNQSDKAYAMYIEIRDGSGSGTDYQGFLFNQNTPYTTHKNISTYSATVTSCENYVYTDYYDFSGAYGSPLEIRLWRFGDNPCSCDFNWLFTLSKNNLV
jgi:hypothetical protein